MIIYYVTKKNEAAPNFKEEARIDRVVAELKNKNPNVRATPLEEAPWAFYKGFIDSEHFWSNAAEPIVVLFETN